MPSYPVPAAPATAEIREKGSRFLAVVARAAGEDEARGLLASLARRHAGATHLCWASRLGWPPRERSSDAGEPAGTGGAPILQALRGAGLSDVMAVVVRWFGGVKLGKGGLARAYGAVTRAALADLSTTRHLACVRLALSVPLTRIGAVKRLIHPPEVELESERYDDGLAGGTGEAGAAGDAGGTAGAPAGAAEIVLRVDEERRAGLEAALAELRVGVRLAASLSSH
jgi:uncharacterized YigZ family protein